MKQFETLRINIGNSLTSYNGYESWISDDKNFVQKPHVLAIFLKKEPSNLEKPML